MITGHGGPCPRPGYVTGRGTGYTIEHPCSSPCSHPCGKRNSAMVSEGTGVCRQSHHYYSKASYPVRSPIQIINLGSMLLQGDLRRRGSPLSSRRKPDVATTDRELLESITRDLRFIYSDVLKQPLPRQLAAALVRLECRKTVSASQKPHRPNVRPARQGIRSGLMHNAPCEALAG
jgi:hypothetical protein